MAKGQPYADNGVVISKNTITLGDNIEISYKGLLAECGANEVFLYGGYGDNWDGNFLLPMENDGSEFKVNFKVSKAGNLNITFRDSAFNWDNNSSVNYTFQVKPKSSSEKTITKSKKEVEKTEKVEKSAKTKAAKPKSTTSTKSTKKPNTKSTKN